MMIKRKITMQMIADASGYSKYVVSKALNGKDGVSPGTRQKVISVAKQLGYYADRPAVSWEKTGSSGNLQRFALVVMPNHRFQTTVSHYWSKVFDGVIGYLESLGVGAMVLSSKDNLASNIKSDGLIGIITLGFVPTEMLLELNKHQVPIVMVDHEDSIIRADSIFADSLNGTYTLTNYLAGIGHRNLLFIGDQEYSQSFYDRWLGFRKAVEQNGLNQPGINTFNIEYGKGDNQEKIEPYILQLKEKGILPTAFVCANDNIAETVVKILSSQGVMVPEECSVTGFDNLDYVKNLPIPLTTVQVPKVSIGRRAVSMLLWRLENRDFPAEKIYIATEAVIRDSTGPCPNQS